MNEPSGSYKPGQIEPHWQEYWKQHQVFHVGNPGEPGFDTRKPKYYILDMFPYTSGSGLHVGHPEGYTATDILARYKRMKGFNVLHPIGWDSFGLPAEQYAVQTNVHPRETTEKAITRFKAQLQRFGFSYDWDRAFATTDPAYFKWTQWIFLQMFHSWFDPTARGKDEKGHDYFGKARPISELIAELEQGRWKVTPEGELVSGDSRKGSGAAPLRLWTELDAPKQRKFIDRQRLAYMDEVPVNWCPMLGTVLSNEEVTNEGRSERGDYPVYRRPLKQWMLRITSYCERLLHDLAKVDWPEAIKAMQQNWVGKSTGAEVVFPIAEYFKSEQGQWHKKQTDGHWTSITPQEILTSPHIISVFTTRPDTLFGATYMVLAPEHPLVEIVVTSDKRPSVQAYVETARRKSEVERTITTRDKSGVFTGAYAINPASGTPIPIWIADYVLMGYGTGAIMAVPAHDERDHAFAKQYELPIVEVVSSNQDVQKEAFVGEGIAVNSGPFDGLTTAEFKTQIVQWLQQQGLGRARVNYKLRDWLFSRQRYWGEPFPILHSPDGDLVAVPENELPVDLPHMEDFRPQASEDPKAPPQPPLGKASEWTTVQRDGVRYERELNTMPQWAGSCWYYLRYLDPKNDQLPWNRDAEKYWMNVDQYVGGAEHAVLHLLYARFWHKVLYDLGHVSTVEPFQRLFNQGLILSHAYRDQRGMVLPVDQVEEQSEGTFIHKQTGAPVEQIVAKMSKALKNVVNPDEILDEFGADTFRLYEMYMGPLDAAKPWNTRDIPGLQRFLNRVWRLVIDEQTDSLSDAVQVIEPTAHQLRILHRTIQKVSEDIEAFKFNTAIAEMITFTNEMTAEKVRPVSILQPFVLLLSPFAPHIAEELWKRLGHSGTLAYEPWPVHDPNLARVSQLEIPVQINGKVKGRITIDPDADASAMESAARSDPKVAAMLKGKTVRKVVTVPGKLIGFVIS